jgi:hypothetical protein
MTESIAKVGKSHRFRSIPIPRCPRCGGPTKNAMTAGKLSPTDRECLTCRRVWRGEVRTFGERLPVWEAKL